MKPGDRIEGIVGYVAVQVERLPGVTRILTAHEPTLNDDGARAQVLTSHVADAPRFERLHRALRDRTHPSLITPTSIVEGPTGLLVVRAPTRGDASRLRGPHAAPIVAAIGARLLPPILHAGAALDGALHPHDIALDRDGAPVLAPIGLPLDTPGTLRSPRTATTAASPDALHGLGLLLVSLATGDAPDATTARTVSGPLGEAIVLLLDDDPARRAAALPILRGAAGPLPDLRHLVGAEATPRAPHPAAVPTDDGVKLTVRADAKPQSASFDHPDRALVVIPADHTRALTPTTRDGLAGHLGVPRTTVRALVDAGLPIALGPDGAHNATAHGPFSVPTVLLNPAGLALAAFGSGLLGLAFMLAALGIVSALASVIPLAIGLGVLALAGGLGGAVAVFGGMQRRATYRRARTSWRRIVQARRASDHPVTGPARRAIARTRQRIATADLPGLAEADLYSAIRALEDQLDAHEAAPQAPAQLTERHDLRARTATAIIAGLADVDRAIDELQRADSVDEDPTGQALARARRAAHALGQTSTDRQERR